MACKMVCKMLCKMVGVRKLLCKNVQDGMLPIQDGAMPVRRLTARTLLCCYGESIGITGLFSPRKVVEWRWAVACCAT